MMMVKVIISENLISAILVESLLTSLEKAEVPLYKYRSWDRGCLYRGCAVLFSTPPPPPPLQYTIFRRLKQLLPQSGSQPWLTNYSAFFTTPVTRADIRITLPVCSKVNRSPRLLTGDFWTIVFVYFCQ